MRRSVLNDSFILNYRTHLQVQLGSKVLGKEVDLFVLRACSHSILGKEIIDFQDFSPSKLHVLTEVCLIVDTKLSYYNRAVEDRVQNILYREIMEKIVLVVLVKREKGPENDTWRWIDDLTKAYIDYHLEGKVIFEKQRCIMPWIEDVSKPDSRFVDEESHAGELVKQDQIHADDVSMHVHGLYRDGRPKRVTRRFYYGLAIVL